jgi:acyl-coenzyme A thioesterase PaaI-like protein
MQEFTASPGLRRPCASRSAEHAGGQAAGLSLQLPQARLLRDRAAHAKELTQHNGYLQGGIIGTLADFAAGSAAGTLLPPGWVNMTTDFTVKLIAPADGEQVLARGG